MRLQRPHCLLWIIVLLATAGAASPSVAQNTYTWNNSGSTAAATAWLSPGNWTGGIPTLYPGRVTAFNTGNGALDDIAIFNATLPSNSPRAVGINMGAAGSPAVLQLGSIQFANNSGDLLIGNSSASVSGTLQLNGATLFVGGTSTDNVVIFNGSSTQTLTIQNTVVSGGQSMGVSLGVANAVIHANVGSTISISAAISETGGSSGLAFAGQGTTILSGTANSYSGGTTVSAGTLRVTNSSGSATGSGSVTVSPGATLSGTGTIIPNTGTPANNTVTVNGTVKPGTDSATGYLTVGDISTPATVNVNGTYRWSVSSAGTSSATPGGSDTNDPNNQSRLVVKGSLTFAPTTIDVVGLSGLSFDNTQAYSWRVATATGTVTVGAQPTFNTTGLDTGGGSFTLSSGLGAVFVGFSPAPEPSGLLVVCAGATCVTWIWKRRSRPRQVVSVTHDRRTE